MSISKNRNLLNQVRDVMRLHHYSIHTERTYCDWIKRYVRHHRMTDRQDSIDGGAKIEALLTHLAVDKDVSPSTQNQDMNALVFLYKQVLKTPLGGKIDAVRATKKVNMPVVMTREEVARTIAPMEGTPQFRTPDMVLTTAWQGTTCASLCVIINVAEEIGPGLAWRLLNY